MRGAVSAVLVAAAAAVASASAIPAARQTSPTYAGYLISTFSDADPRVQWHLSEGNSATSFRFLNGGSPVLSSTVGTKGVRDIFLTTNPSRSEFFLIATGELSFTYTLRLSTPLSCLDPSKGTSRMCECQRVGIMTDKM